MPMCPRSFGALCCVIAARQWLRVSISRQLIGERGVVLLGAADGRRTFDVDVSANISIRNNYKEKLWVQGATNVMLYISLPNAKR